MIRNLDEAVEIIAQLLHSTTKTDAEHAIKFFERADVFGCTKAKLGFNKMLPLVMDKDNQKLVEAYQIYFF